MVPRLVILLAAGGCTFHVGATGAGDAADAPPGDARDAADGSPGDASPCRAVEVSAMSAHSCARMETGDVWCWGINKRGEVGRPSQTACNGAAPCNPMPEKLALPPATRLGVAEEHSCVITGTGVQCWGGNVQHQFGNGTGVDTAAPIIVTQRAGATQIGGGLSYGCSLHGTAVKCSGDNANGEVGDNSSAQRPTPVTTVPSGVDAIATGYHHVCAIEGGFLYCWGDNGVGEVDSHPGADAKLPRIVMNIATVKTAALGIGHTCVALAAGDLRCWGDNAAGQLGVGDTVPHPDQIATPVLTGIVELSAGANHTCARTPAGSVYCWGERYGSIPVAITLPRPAISIASGSYHDCFALADGSVDCLGWNAYGQLGLGTAFSTVSVTVSQVKLCP